MFGALSPSARKAPPARAGSSPLLGAAAPDATFERAIARLEEVVEQETVALKGRSAIDLNDFNNRKSQGLLDLNRALRGLDAPSKDTAAMARLASLRAKLDANQAVLKMHLEAVREVARVLADAIRDAESDGTYSPSIRGCASRP
jgi:hypothetical protein